MKEKVLSLRTQKEDRYSDEELVSLALRDKEFFAILISRYTDRLFRYVIRISGVTRETAEDIVQESFIKAYLNLNNFDTDLKFSSWMYRITHHQAISAHRKRKIRPEGNQIDVEDSVLHQIASDEDIAKNLDREMDAKTLREALDTLDTASREILILKYFEDKDYAEMADILEKPMGTVATLIHRAKKKLRAIMEERTK